MFLELTIAIALALAGAVLAYCAKHVLGWARRAVLLRSPPSVRDQHFLLGATFEMLKPDQHMSMRAWAKQLGGIYTFRLLHTHVRPMLPLSVLHEVSLLSHSVL